MPSYDSIRVDQWDDPLKWQYINYRDCRTMLDWVENPIGSPPISETRSYVDREVFESRGPTIDADSWSAIRHSGRIKMTNYHNSKVTISNSIGGIPHLVAGSFYFKSWGNHTCQNCNRSQRTQRGSYTEFGDLGYWKGRFPTSPHSTYVIEDYEAELERAKTALVAEAASSYDLLTELAELKETLSTIKSLLSRVINPLTSYKKARDRILRSRRPHEETAKLLADLWLEYQYGIMPIVYSIEDLKDLWSNKDDMYQTVRSRFRPSVRFEDKPSSGIYFFDEGAVSLSVNLTGKSRYDQGSFQKLFDQISFNPLTTAWELVPYSFVVDWFINVGDWLTAMTSVLTDISSERAFCYSIKENSTVSTYLHYEHQYDLSFNYPAAAVAPWCTHPAWSGTLLDDKIELDILLQVREVDSYVRTTFQPSEVKLTLSPYLSWQRWVTSFALSLRPLLKGLRSLR